jgi:hypothetical protein
MINKTVYIPAALEIQVCLIFIFLKKEIFKCFGTLSSIYGSVLKKVALQYCLGGKS